MSITLFEQLLSFADASRVLQSRPHVSSIWRWSTRGVRGIRLETVQVGGRRFTSREALERFIARTTAARDEAAAVDYPSRKRRIEQADDHLRREGF